MVLRAWTDGWRRVLRAPGVALGVHAVTFLLALPLAALLRERPLTTIALALASIVVTSVSLVSGPLHVAEDAAQWFHRLRHGTDQTGYITQTVLHRFGTDPDIEQALGVLVVIVVAVVLAALVTPRPRLERLDVVLAVAVLVLWRVIYVATPIMFRVDDSAGSFVGAVAAAGLLAGAALAVVLAARGSRPALVVAVLLVPLVWPRLASHTTVALGVVTVALLCLAAILVRGRSVPSPG